MKSFIVKSVLLLALTMVNGQWAMAMEKGKKQDFVAQMMERVTARPDAYSAADYKQITVSPSMMKSVVEMMDKADNVADENAAHNKELYSKLLRNVKSLRIFIANSNPALYQDLAKQVFAKNRRVYKPFKTDDSKADERRQIWIRQSGNNIVEIVVVMGENVGDKPMQILNVTGEFGNEFISLLKQMP